LVVIWFVARGVSAEHWGLEPMKCRVLSEDHQAELAFFVGDGHSTPYSSTITSISFKCGEVVAARRKSFDLDPSSRTHHLAVTSHNSNPITRLGAAGPWNCPEATSEMQRMRGAVLGGAIPAHYERGSDPVSRRSRSRDVGNRNAKPSR
jgi:hypothetical protein